jgi:Fic family protein
MQPAQSKTGRYAPLPHGGLGFIPNPLPPDPPFEVDHEMWTLLSEADRAIGRLDGATEILPNPDLFVAMYVRREAVLSSQIEGTQASLTDLLEYEVKKPTLKRVMDVGEVVNYVAAMNHGLDKLKTEPLSLGLVKELHAKLLAGTRGGDKTPGEFRKDQNWLGPAGSLVTQATYVPPPPEEVGPAMRRLEEYIRRPGPMPPLISLGLVHAQFESIHPFSDGNGRVGRLLVILMLCKSGILKRPLLYLSHYFKKNRSEYYDRLQATRDPGTWEGWLKFFVRGVAGAAREAADTARKIVNLREQHRGLLQANLGQRTAVGLALLERLYLNPVVDIRLVAGVTGKSYINANRLVSELEKLGLLKETTGHRRNRRFAYQPYLDLFEEPKA